MKRLVSRILVIVLLLAVLVIGWQLNLTPSHNRDWQTHYSQTPDATVTAEGVYLYNVRNWNHNEEEVVSDEWQDEVFIDPQDISRVWFVLSAFSDSELAGHSFLSFELTDGRVYTLSIEARREVGETYGVLKGLLREYELWYGWGTERDFLGVSSILLKRSLEMYPLELTKSQKINLFRSVAKATSDIATTPRFYNTLSANCTNLLAKIINAEKPGTIPYHFGWNLPGLAPAFLADQGFIAVPDGVTNLRTHYRIDTPPPALLNTIDQTPEDFSRVLREVVTSQIEDF